MKPDKMDSPSGEQRFWAIKTTRGGPQHPDCWREFKNPKNPGGTTVAVGWPAIRKDPRKFPDCQGYVDYVDKEFDADSRASNAFAARTIYRFAHDWHIGDIAVVCVGFGPRQTSNVFLYGFALVGTFFMETKGAWNWHFRRSALLSVIEREVPVDIFRDAFGGSMIGTINGPFQEEQVLRFSERVHKLYPQLWPGLCPVRRVTFRE